MCSGGGTRALPRVGFPIRKSPDQRLISSSPRLIAAVHVLHRLQVPRHPPCALLILTVITYSGAQGAEARGDTRFIGKTVQFSRTAQEAPAGFAVGLSKLNSMRGTQLRGAARLRPDPVDIARTCRLVSSRNATRGRTGAPCPGGFPRKEVIQPHLPVRLPCYDFTPVTSPTFDGSLPKRG